MNNYPTYSVSIRTLGTAGEKYQETLNSVARQTIKPEKVLVYIPHGYPLPKETIGIEEYVRCDKGMVTQRSQPFDEITSEFILFLDDDLSFESDFVQKLFDGLISMDGDCISPDIYRCHENSWLIKIRDYLGGTKPHFDSQWSFKIRRDTHYLYNHSPKSNVLLTQSGAFACLLCKKAVHKSIHFEDERWLETIPYGFGDDQLYYYKLFKSGYKVLTSFNAGITHLDASAGRGKDKTQLSYAIGFCRYMIWYRTIYSEKNSKGYHLLCKLSLLLEAVRSSPLSFAIILKTQSFERFRANRKGQHDAKEFSKTVAYAKLPSFFSYKKQ